MKDDNTPITNPDGFRLLEGEEIVAIQSFNSRRPIKELSSAHELRRLTFSTGRSEIGENGPPIAALPYDTDEMMPEHQGQYRALFGRDALKVATDLAAHYPKLARSTLLRLAEFQGTTYTTSKEEEPGRIAHEIRDAEDPIARELSADRGWGWPYYGSVDATPEFIRTLSRYCHLGNESTRFLTQKYLNKNGEERVIADALESAVNWVTNRMDKNPEGLLEYKSVLPLGLENQVWKDSWDSYHHSDGTIANHNKGIASIEVQVIAYDALVGAAYIYENIMDRGNEAAELLERAERLRDTILDLFWTEDKGGYFILGTDRDDSGKIRQLKIRTSNMGHVLNSRVLDSRAEEHTYKRNKLLDQLRSPELLAASGIRTLASDEVRYRDGAYHNGSVWIWDTHHIALGARRHVFHNPDFGTFASDIEDRILDVVSAIGGFPEYVRGGDVIATNMSSIDVRDTVYNRVHRVEQPPQEIQAWTVAAILATKLRRGAKID